MHTLLSYGQRQAHLELDRLRGVEAARCLYKQGPVDDCGVQSLQDTLFS